MPARFTEGFNLAVLIPVDYHFCFGYSSNCRAENINPLSLFQRNEKYDKIPMLNVLGGTLVPFLYQCHTYVIIL